MIQGTASHVGKSILVAALCRIFHQDGFSVAPFKAQNMALNSFVTRDGGEMGRAQVVQAEAAGIEPTVDMNPVLLKPKKDYQSQVIVHGKPIDDMSAQKYHLNYFNTAWEAAKYSLDKLRSEYEIVVIEGAGSPAEVNLRDNDIVNMRVALWSKTPVFLVADIDKGGALASIVGTLALLTEEERETVAGVIINKFRGDIELLKPAIDFLEDWTKKPIAGVIPYFHKLYIQEEDSVSEEKKVVRRKKPEATDIDIVVVYLPHISNFTDFDPLDDPPEVSVRYIRSPEEIGEPDALIIPGTKNTTEDLIRLKSTGIASAIISTSQRGIPVIGICGGYQMLGGKLDDPEGAESDELYVEGLGLLNVETTFNPQKLTHQAKADIICDLAPFTSLKGEEVVGYEIHMGRTKRMPGSLPLFKIKERSRAMVSSFDGAIRDDGLVWGTYLHGIFDNDRFRRTFLNWLRTRKGLSPFDHLKSAYQMRQQGYDELADIVRNNLDMNLVYRVMGIK